MVSSSIGRPAVSTRVEVPQRTAPERFAAACGPLYVALQVAALGALSSAGWPDPGAPTREIAKVFTVTPPASLWVGAYLSVLAALCFLPFAARLCSLLRATQPGNGWLATTALGGAWLLVAAELMGAAATGALLTRAGHSLSAIEAMALFDLAQSLLFLVWAGGSVFLLAVGVSTWRDGVLPRWLAASGGIVGAMFVVAAPISSQLLHLPATLLYVWVVAAGVVLWRAGGQPDRRSTPSGEQ